ncbi:hypothetical protein ZEAMMB73_Zm00001d043096 [Zea mays]|uniref:Uncharacterized protein n=2 Tax=Zea mays TaxID=4577 RepID=A0A1D6N8X1_MAIZE|nr:hypothetical protein ZEAMMB73_Zm00001d043096 [Zea mays]
MPGARGTSHSPQFPHFICVVAEDWEGPTQPFFFVCVKDRERRSTNRAVSLPCVFPLSCGLRWPQLRRAVMEFTSKKTASLALLCLKLSCLLLLLLLPRSSSAAPLSRSLSLTRNRLQPADDPAPEVPAPAQQGAGAGAGAVGARDPGGEVAVRMDIEVNDYPGSGANNRHEPRSPGRP